MEISELKLPKRVEALLEADVFTQDELIDDTMLYRLEFFLPQIIEAVGLVVAELKSQKRLKEILLWKLEKVMLDERRAQVLIGADPKMYPNSDMREARVRTDEAFMETNERIYTTKVEASELQSKIDEWEEKGWRYRNLQNNLDNISKLRISERKY